MMRGLKTSGGVQRRVTGFAGAADERGCAVGRLLGLGGGAAAFFGTGGRPCGH
jgi:hypothetical protein